MMPWPLHIVSLPPRSTYIIGTCALDATDGYVRRRGEQRTACVGSAYQGSVSSSKWSAQPIASTETPPLSPVLVHWHASGAHVLYAAAGSPATDRNANDAEASMGASVTMVAHFSPPAT